MVAVVAAGPTTARVRLSFAGARRTTGERRRSGSVTAGSAVRRRRPRPSGPIGPSASRRASHSPTASVCGRRSGSMPAVASAAGRRARRRRQLARQDVVDHLAALAEGGLDEPPQLVLGRGVEAVVRVVRLDDDDRRLDRRARARTPSAGTREGDPDPGVVLDEDRQVAHLPGRRRDPLGDLALDHQHEPAGRGGAPSSACRIGLVMWYGRLATTSYGGSTRWTRSWSSASPSMSAERLDARRSARAGRPPARDRARRR